MQLLERDQPLRELQAALDDAAGGEGRLALVSGEAGIGKTALVEQFARQQGDAVRVLWGACDALFTPRPLGPLYDLAAQTRGELAALLASDADRQAVFSACLGELQSRPAIVVFEDVHWADEATLDLVKFLGRRIQRTASLLILTYRDDELGLGHPLRLVLGDLPRSATLRLSLPPLSPDSVLALARDAKQAELVGEIYAATGGNPFFVTEVLASGGAQVPPTVRDAVLTRAARLSAAARQVLDAASIVPGRVETWLLEAVLPPSPASVQECIERGMLRAGGDTLSFRHELARRTLEDALAPPQRRAIHQQVLTVLKERGADQVQLSRLVHHAAFAGDGQAVLRFAPPAADQAAAVGAHLEAAAHYQTALRYADRLDPAGHAQLLERRAYECYVTSQIEEAIQARAEALTIWRRIGSTKEEGDNLRWLSRLHWFQGQYAQAERYAVDAIRLLETLPPGRELAMAYSNRAQLHMLTSEMAEAVQLGNQAVALAQAVDDQETVCHALNNVGTSELLVVYDEAGRRKLEQSLAIALAHGYHEHAARAYTNLACQAVEHHDYALAMGALNDGIAYSLERDLDAWSLYMLAWRARAFLEQGRWAEAGDDALAVLNSPRAATIARLPALAVLGRLRARRGDPEVPLVLDEARDLARDTHELQRIGPVAAARAEAAWLAGDPARCLAEAEAAYDLAVGKQHHWFTGELGLWRWRAGQRIALPSWTARPYALQVQGDWRAAAAEWKRLGCPYEQALALMDGDEAAQLEALGTFERLGARPAADLVRQMLQAVPARQLEKAQYGGLTPREREAAALIAEGKTNREIAAAMTVREKTVETYVTRILNKLGFDSRVQIATWAVEAGLAAPAAGPDA